jgi:hypothetical protein
LTIAGRIMTTTRHLDSRRKAGCERSTLTGRGFRIALLALVLGGAGYSASAANAITAGDLVIQGVTLHSVALRWDIKGDDNRNAQVKLSYRETAGQDWYDALPPLRIGGEDTGTETYLNDHVTDAQFAGAVSGLAAGTEYELRLILTDVDGGNRNRVVTASTRSMLLPDFADSKIFHLYPKDETKVKLEPNYTSLSAAVGVAGPGDVVLVHAGTYEGSYVIQTRGEPGKPIFIKAAGDGEAVFVGEKSRPVIEMQDAAHLWFEGLTFRDPGSGDGHHTGNGVVMFAGNRKRRAPSSCVGLTVRYCKFEDFGTGIMAADYHCRDFTITDNYFYGRQNWLGPLENKEFNYLRYSGSAITVSGQGHDIAHNYIESVRSGVRITNGRDGRGYRAGQQNVAIDIYGNDITQVGRDFVDISEGDQNILLQGNRCTNSGRVGFTIGPVYGGPVYVIRNVVYNIMRPLPMHLTRNATGVEAYHNTFVTDGWISNEPFSNGKFYNNIFLGRMSVNTATDYSMLDYNAWKEGPVTYRSPATSAKAEFEALVDLADQTGFEAHGVTMSFGDFEKLKRAKLKQRTYEPDRVNYHLLATAGAVDSAMAMPGINRNEPTGKNFDIGAWEFGQVPPHYGPRPVAQ